MHPITPLPALSTTTTTTSVGCPGGWGFWLLCTIPLVYLAGWWIPPSPGRFPGQVILALGAWLLAGGLATGRTLPRLPAVFCLLGALAWPGLHLIFGSALVEPGLTILIERAAALATALAIVWLPARSLGGWSPAVAVGAAAAVVLVLAAACAPFGTWRGGGTGWAGQWAAMLSSTPPFGLDNWNIAALLPLVPLAAAASAEVSPSWRHLALGLTLAGLIAAGGYASGFIDDSQDKVHATGLALAAMAITAVILPLPTRLGLPLLAALVGLALLGQCALVLGWLPANVLPEFLRAPSSQVRLGIWQASLQAWSEAPWFGYGLGQAQVILPQYPGFLRSWLAQPCFPEHTHHEFLQQAIDGGLLQLALILAAGWSTLRPLWQRRRERLPALLLIGWAGVVGHALVDDHLGQPGSLACLAVLAGLSWRENGATAVLSVRLVRWPGMAVSLILGLLVAGQVALATRGRGPAALAYEYAIQKAPPHPDQAQEWWADFLQRQGPLLETRFWYAQAIAQQADAAIGQGEYQKSQQGIAVAINQAEQQLRQLPVDTQTIWLLRKLGTWCSRNQRQDAAQRCQVLIERSQERIRSLLGSSCFFIREDIRKSLERAVRPPPAEPGGKTEE